MSYEDFDEGWRKRTGMGLADQVAFAADERSLSFEREPFVAAVTDNLEDGRFTLLVAVDEITDELQRIVEYLSAHTVADMRVAALELGYVAEGDLEVLVPQVFGLRARRAEGNIASGSMDGGRGLRGPGG